MVIGFGMGVAVGTKVPVDVAIGVVVSVGVGNASVGKMGASVTVAEDCPHAVTKKIRLATNKIEFRITLPRCNA